MCMHQESTAIFHVLLYLFLSLKRMERTDGNDLEDDEEEKKRNKKNKQNKETLTSKLKERTTE